MAEMWITMGPQHPMTHGLWTLRVKVDGETVVDTIPELGYIHRGVEKICESRDYTQITPYCDRLCYASAMTWAQSYIYAAENLLGAVTYNVSYECKICIPIENTSIIYPE